MCIYASFTECLLCWAEFGYCPYEVHGVDQEEV